ncbi:MAG: PAS domain S-box protein [Dehalococcoidia bacterium]|nr:PAS domain S-box protein [Dehalococcoidia bacterium]
MSDHAFDRLGGKRREQTPLALARLVVVGLFICLWVIFWLARAPMPLPFLVVLLLETGFFLIYWRTVFALPSVTAVERANRVMLAAEILFHTTIVYFLGGVSWLGAFAYVFGLIFTNTFLDLRRGFVYTMGANVAFTALILLEATGVVPHYVYLEQGPLRYSDPQFVATTIVGGGGVFFSIYLWVNWVGHQLRRERDLAVRTQEHLLKARAALEEINEDLEARVADRTVELEQANAALRESAQQLRTVVASAPVVLFALDCEGTFTLAEGKGLDALGTQRTEVVGRSALELFERNAAVQEDLRRALSGEEFSATVTVARRALETHYTPLPGREGGVAGVIGVAIDITERKDAEQQLQLLQTITRAVGEARDFNSALAVALAEVCRSAGWDFGEAWVPTDEGDVLECSPAWYAAERRLDQFRTATQDLTFTRNVGLPGLVWSLRRPVWIDDIARDGAFVRTDAAVEAGLKAALGVPIIDEGDVIAILAFYMERSGEEDTKMVDVVSAIATQLGSVLQRKRAGEALLESEATLKATLESTADGILVVSGDGRVSYANPMFAEMWRIPTELLQTRDDDRLLAFVLDQLAEPEAFLSKVRELYRSSDQSLDTLLFKDGRVFERYSRPLMREGRVDGRVWSFRDITEREHSQEALKQSESKFRAMAETVAAAVFIVQGDGMPYVNSAAETLSGYSRDELVAMNFWDVIHPESQELVKERGRARQRGEQIAPRYEVKLLTKSGEEKWVDVTAGLIEFEGRPAVLGTAFDITERKRAEEALQEAANRDPLTGLLNRRAGVTAITERLEQAKRASGRFAAFVLDLDRFKSINDSFNHETGDAALLTFARVLSELVGERGVICRLGGDEFEIGIEDMDAEQAISLAQALHVSLRAAVQPAPKAEAPNFTVSVGIACYPEDGADIATLGRRADEAMYAAKATGSGLSCAWRDLASAEAA